MQIAGVQWLEPGARALNDGASAEPGPSIAPEDRRNAAGDAELAENPASWPAAEHPAARPVAPAPTGQGDSTTAPASSAPGSLSPERAQALAEARTDFQQALAQARQDPTRQGPGWIVIQSLTKGNASTGASPSEARKTPTVPVGKPDPRPGQAKDSPGAVFNEAAFRDAYLAQAGPALQALALAYGASSVPQLLEAHPELRWTVLDISGGTSDPFRPPLNGEGPPPLWVPPYSTQALIAAGPSVQAMMQQANQLALAQYQATLAGQPQSGRPNASTQTLQAIDGVLSSPANQLLLAQYGGSVPTAGELDPAKVATYGLQRAQVMALLERATAAVGPPPSASAFKAEALVGTEWLARRAELARQLCNEFDAYDHQARGAASASRGALSTGPLVQIAAWGQFLQTSATAAALARHMGLDGVAALSVAVSTPSAGALLSEASWRGGPAPAGTAMGTAEAIGAVDLALSDPDNQALIQQFGGPAPTPNGGLANEQVRLYGLKRYQAMTQLSSAMAAVRQDYLTQLNDAKSKADNPAFLKDGKFSVEAFTAWYEAQPGAAHQAFTRLMGPMTTRVVPGEETGQFIGEPEFALSPWRLVSAPPRPGEAPTLSFQVNDPAAPSYQAPSLLSIDPQSPPALNSFQYVGFDASLGWLTPRQNIHHHESGIGEVLHDVAVGSIIAGYAWAGGVVAATATGPAEATLAATAANMATGTTLSVTSLMAAGAASGATAAVLSGVVGSGTFSWKDVLKGALTGAFTAGIAGELKGIQAISDFAAANPAAYGAALGGTTQALLGESFRLGALAGFVNGFASEVTAGLNSALLQDPNMSADAMARARIFIKTLDAAIRIAGDPSNPSQAFAAAFLNSVVNDPALHPPQDPAPEPEVQTHPVAPQPELEPVDLPDTPPADDPSPGAQGAGGSVQVAGPADLSLLTPTSFWRTLSLNFLRQVLIPLGEALSGTALFTLTLLLAPSNLGSSTRRIELSDNRRFVLGFGADYGSIEVRNDAGDWVPNGVGANYRLVNVNGVLTPMTDAQQSAYQATLHAPTTVPWTPQPAPAAPAPAATTAPAPAPVPSPAAGPVAAPAPAVHPPAVQSPAPAPSVASPTPAPVQPPAAAVPAPIPAPAAQPAQMAPIETPAPLPGYADSPPPDITVPPLIPPPASGGNDPLIITPIQIPPPSGPPPSGSTTPVNLPTVLVTPQAPVETWDDSIIEARPSVDEPTYHYPIRDDFDNHLVNVDTWRGGGGHNEANFLAWVNSVGGLYEIRPTGVNGVHEVYAIIPHPKDPSKAVEIHKTTYDASVYSDAEMNRMAREAGKLAWDRYQSGDVGDAEDPTMQTSYDVTVDGVRFRAYVNKDTAGQPSIGNVHPIFENEP